MSKAREVTRTRRSMSPEAFREPSRDFGILPFWFLNGALDHDEMLFQLKELRDKGMHGVVFHGRYGLEMPYLSEAYLERIRFGVEEANRLGLAAWIYDEMNWPSGTADKRVLRERPDLAQRYLECVSFTITGPWFMCLTGEDSRYLDFEKSTPVAAFAIGEDGRVVDLTRNLSFGKVVPWEVPPGTWRLCYMVEKRADYYIDAMDPESTTEFLRLGYAPYLDALGNGSRDAEGRSVVGFYSDEPAMHYFVASGDNPIVPWTRNMFRRFEERNGYDLRSRLVDLFFDVHPDAARTRHDFYSTTTAMYTDAYYRQIHDWCRERGVTFTAHLLFEEWLRGMIRVEGNLFSHYANMDVVAVDHLYPVIGTRESPEQHVAMKVASSAAHHFGSERLICESFGGIFMDATMQRMKWIADWEYVLGVNLLNPHGFHYTFEGARKRDWPPSMFYQYPWWRYYEGFSQYMSRLSEMLSGGRHVAKVAMLWPINSAFATYLPQEHTAENDLVQGGLNVLTDLLMRLHHDFDYLDEDVLAGADVTGRRVRVADEEYELVVVPPMTHLRAGTLETLERFVAGGGRVLGVLRAPGSAFGADGTTDVRDRVGALLGGGVDGDAATSFGTERQEHEGGGVGAFLAGPAVVMLGPPGEERDALTAALRDAIRDLIAPDVEISNEDLFSLHRERDGRGIVFVANPTFERQEARVRLAGAVDVVLWDPTTGDERPVGPVEDADGGVTFDLALPATGSAFLVTSPRGTGPRVVKTNLELDSVDAGTIRGRGPVTEGWVEMAAADGATRRLSATASGPAPAPVVLADGWTFRPEDDNALVVREWRARPEAPGETGPPEGGEGWLPVVAGAWAYQLPAEPDRDWPIPVWFRVPFEVEEAPERLCLLIDGFHGEDARILLNGEEVTSKPVRSAFDAEMRELDLTPWARTGPNVLHVRLVLPEATSGLVDNVKLVGSFGLAGEEASGWRIARAGTAARPESWTTQGFPFYSGLKRYTADRKSVV